jgi:hypothetical protein
MEQVPIFPEVGEMQQQQQHQQSSSRQVLMEQQQQQVGRKQNTYSPKRL